MIEEDVKGVKGKGLKMLRAGYSKNMVLLPDCGHCRCKRYNKCGCVKTKGRSK